LAEHVNIAHALHCSSSNMLSCMLCPAPLSFSQQIFYKEYKNESLNSDVV